MAKRSKQKDDSSAAGYELRDVGELCSMDPRLQEIVAAHRRGEDVDAVLAETDDDDVVWVQVAARLVDPAVEVPGLRVVTRIKSIVTGRVRAEDIEKVRRHENVRSLKSAAKVRPQLVFSMPEIRATSAQLAEEGLDGIDGSGVIIGVVDFGCDVNHHALRNADGSTRLLALWDQRGGRTSLSPAPYGYGRRFDRAAVDRALGEEEPHEALGYHPGFASHGTHVMDIASGSAAGRGHGGVAAGADLIFVHLSADDVNDDETSFGNSVRLLEAVDFIFAEAKRLGRPAAVNLSLGTNGGPHDGSSPVEEGIDELLEEPGRAVVIAAGNSWLDRSHAQATLEPGDERSLSWNMLLGDPTSNEIEIWYQRDGELALRLVAPSGQRIGPVAAGETKELLFGGRRVGRIFHRRDDPNNGDHQINVILDAELALGRWRVELENVSRVRTTFHAWVERDAPDAGSRLSDADDDRSHTVGSISCGRRSIVVGSYDARVPDRTISEFSSEGPTRDGRPKPEISAPGHGVVAASSGGQGFVRKWGTSMAAPHVTGVVALLMQASGGALTCDELRNLLARHARTGPPAGAGDGWHPRYGRGRVQALEPLSELLGAEVDATCPQPAAPPTVVASGARRRRRRRRRSSGGTGTPNVVILEGTGTPGVSVLAEDAAADGDPGGAPDSSGAPASLVDQLVREARRRGGSIEIRLEL